MLVEHREYGSSRTLENHRAEEGPGHLADRRGCRPSPSGAVLEDADLVAVGVAHEHTQPLGPLRDPKDGRMRAAHPCHEHAFLPESLDGADAIGATMGFEHAFDDRCRVGPRAGRSLDHRGARQGTEGQGSYCYDRVGQHGAFGQVWSGIPTVVICRGIGPLEIGQEPPGSRGNTHVVVSGIAPQKCR